MDQSHIGYTTCGIRPKTIWTPSSSPRSKCRMRRRWAWPRKVPAPPGPARGRCVLPGFDVFNQPRHFIDVFNQGKTPFEFTAAASIPGLCLSETKGTVVKDQRLWINVDWSKAPKGAASGMVILAGTSNNVAVKVKCL